MKSNPLQEISTEYEKAGMLAPDQLGRMLTQAGYRPEESSQLAQEQAQPKGLSKLAAGMSWSKRGYKKVGEKWVKDSKKS